MKWFKLELLRDARHCLRRAPYLGQLKGRPRGHGQARGHLQRRAAKLLGQFERHLRWLATREALVHWSQYTNRHLEDFDRGAENRDGMACEVSVFCRDSTDSSLGTGLVGYGRDDLWRAAGIR